MKLIDKKSKYKVSGVMLQIILNLADLYNTPLYYENEKILKVLPFPTEKRDYLIGRLIAEFENCEWEQQCVQKKK